MEKTCADSSLTAWQRFHEAAEGTKERLVIDSDQRGEYLDFRSISNWERIRAFFGYGPANAIKVAAFCKEHCFVSNHLRETVGRTRTFRFLFSGLRASPAYRDVSLDAIIERRSVRGREESLEETSRRAALCFQHLNALTGRRNVEQPLMDVFAAYRDVFYMEHVWCHAHVSPESVDQLRRLIQIVVLRMSPEELHDLANTTLFQIYRDLDGEVDSLKEWQLEFLAKIDAWKGPPLPPPEERRDFKQLVQKHRAAIETFQDLRRIQSAFATRGSFDSAAQLVQLSRIVRAAPRFKQPVHDMLSAFCEKLTLGEPLSEDQLLGFCEVATSDALSPEQKETATVALDLLCATPTKSWNPSVAQLLSLCKAEQSPDGNKELQQLAKLAHRALCQGIARIRDAEVSVDFLRLLIDLGNTDYHLWPQDPHRESMPEVANEVTSTWRTIAQGSRGDWIRAVQAVLDLPPEQQEKEKGALREKLLTTKPLLDKLAQAGDLFFSRRGLQEAQERIRQNQKAQRDEATSRSDKALGAEDYAGALQNMEDRLSAIQAFEDGVAWLDGKQIPEGSPLLNRDRFRL